MWPLAAALTMVVAWALRGRIGRGPAAALAFFGVTLAPALGFVNVFPMRYSFVADHFQYLASLGLLTLAAALAAGMATSVSVLDGREALPPRSREDVSSRTAGGRRGRLSGATARTGWGGALAGVILVTLGVLTWRQCRIYADAETLWRDTIAKNPAAWIAHNNLAFIDSRRGRISEAIAGYNEALRLHPDFLEAHIGLGALLHRQGELAEAGSHFEAAVRIKPDD